MSTRKAIALILTVLVLAEALTACSNNPAISPVKDEQQEIMTQTPSPVPENTVIASPVPSGLPSGGNRLSNINSYVCYYSDGEQPGVMDKLASVDLAIIDARILGGWPFYAELEYGAPYIAKLKSAGTIVTAYLSIGEDSGEYDPSNGWYVDTEPTVWNSYVVDPSNEKWRAKVMSDAKLIMDQGADGFFLDTLDSTGCYPIYESMQPYIVSLVKMIRDAYPDAVIIANRGFAMTAAIAPFIDGLMFEGFSTEYNGEYYTILDEQALSWNADMANYLKGLAAEYDFRIIVLDYLEDRNNPIAAEIRQRSEDFGFLCYIAFGPLDEVYF